MSYSNSKHKAKGSLEGVRKVNNTTSPKSLTHRVVPSPARAQGNSRDTVGTQGNHVAGHVALQEACA